MLISAHSMETGEEQPGVTSPRTLHSVRCSGSQSERFTEYEELVWVKDKSEIFRMSLFCCNEV